MQILFVNNDGGGFADRIEIQDGMTVKQLFAQRLPYGQPQDYLIRVNRQPTTADTVLQPDDRVTITPTKIEGAALPAPSERFDSPFQSPTTSEEFHASPVSILPSASFGSVAGDRFRR